ncbi:Ferredoxin-NADP reductase [Streptomyces sp. yr375]|uniref:PDR/VanB family oxidoreductase n=1 Tax=Streptomyces sp. yr375 TaxID=1761906 RepID=UPI0008C55FBD|nr:PDR/VanB family oxidoreductase [Streptomyces sp. yr375]SEQ93289.1 Ferredoxin-NADP reductase [Streptomyces sp. yr375]
MPRPLTLVTVAGAALFARLALRRRIRVSPLWPMPALAEPVSGRPRSRALRLRVAARAIVAEGVVQLRLEGGRLPGWEPGAHVDLVLPSGRVRQYSLCGDPADSAAYTVAVRLVAEGRGGRGGSREVHELLREGSEVEVRGPRNRFPLVAAPSYVFVAGGIGITPLLPMLRALPEDARWRLVLAGRTRASMPFLAEVERLGGDQVTVVEGRPDLDALLTDLPEGAAVYCCGPEGLMAAVAERVPHVRLERFAPGSLRDGTAFEVELRRSGRVLTVPADSTALAAVRAALPDTAYSCEQGFCGTCRQRVLAGEVDHRDELLGDAERADSMLLCVSRARSRRLVLDM